jgi:antitoxin MazE
MMKVSKWGNSLAIRLPAELVERLGVAEGDELYAIPGMAEESQLTIRRKKTAEELLQSVRKIRETNPIPADYKFKRSDAYEADEF